MRFLGIILAAAALAPAAPAPGEARPDLIGEALSRLYNFDFTGAHQALDQHIRRHPADPLGPAMRAATHLFFELDRLMILEGEFFTDDRRIAEKKKIPPDPEVRKLFFEGVEEARRLARQALAREPDDPDALFSLCIASGLVTDYTALIEKRQLRSLSSAKEAHNHALRLLRVDPNYYDAYLSTGLSEYLLGSLPFFLRWFIRFDDVEGSKQEAIRKLTLVARQGRYFQPFAKILLAIIYLREKKPEESLRLLRELLREFPGNPLFSKEIDRISAKLRSGELKPGA